MNPIILSDAAGNADIYDYSQVQSPFRYPSQSLFILIFLRYLDLHQSFHQSHPILYELLQISYLYLV